MASEGNQQRPQQAAQDPVRAVREQEKKTSTSVTGAGETSVDREAMPGPNDSLGTEEERDWEFEKKIRAQETVPEGRSRKK